MSGQKQETDEGSFGIQSGRDTIIHAGPSTEEVRRIVQDLIRAELSNYSAQAQARLRQFEARILEEVMKPRGIRAQAFTDPDFQFLLRSAQHAHARSGDDNVREVLIDLIGRRSQVAGHGRLSLSLSQAVETAGRLTKNEFAELSLSYVLRYTLDRGVRDLNAFAAFFRRNISPLLPDISTELASYQHIEAQSCGNIGFGTLRLIHLLRENYPVAFAAGFDRTEVERQIISPATRQFINGLLVPCVNDTARVQLLVQNKKELLDRARLARVSDSEAEMAWNKFQQTIWDGELFLTNVEKTVPEIRNLTELWDKSMLHKLTLTNIGIAIGHANLARLGCFPAELSIWIK